MVQMLGFIYAYLKNEMIISEEEFHQCYVIVQLSEYKDTACGNDIF